MATCIHPQYRTMVELYSKVAARNTSLPTQRNTPLTRNCGHSSRISAAPRTWLATSTVGVKPHGHGEPQVEEGGQARRGCSIRLRNEERRLRHRRPTGRSSFAISPFKNAHDLAKIMSDAEGTLLRSSLSGARSLRHSRGSMAAVRSGTS